MKRVIGLIVLCVVLCGCTRKVYVPVERVRTEYRDADTTALYGRLLSLFDSRERRDSTVDSLVERTHETIVLDSSGDTAKHYATRYVYLSSRQQRDMESKIVAQDSIIRAMRYSLTEARGDSVPVIIEKNLTKWQKIKMDYGGVGIIMGPVIILFLLAIVIYKFKKNPH